MNAIPLDLPFVDFLRNQLTTALIWAAIGVAVATPFNCVAYCAGGYVIRETTSAAGSKPATPRARLRRRLWITAGVIVAATIVGLAIGIYRIKQMEEAIAYCDQGVEEYKKKEYDQAIDKFTKAMQLRPGFVRAYDYRAWCYLDKAEYDKVLADADEALKIQPKDAAAYTNRGYAYYGQGDFDKAIVELTQAIDISPKVASRWASRAEAHGQQGEHDKAITDFTEAIRLKPETWRYYADRGNAYFYKGDFAKAFADFDKARRLERESEKAEEEKE
jgi:tetratricopeptide (TPR) repeat protein